jgi:subtilisin family serine protease
MKKSAQCLFSIAVFFAIIFIGISAIAKDKGTPGNGGKKYSPVISEKVKQKAEAGEEVAVLIKLKEEWEHPSVKKMTTAADPARFISKKDIKRLQKALEASFSPEETKKDIKVIHKLENIPWITGKINQKALEKLKVHPNVAIIAEDTKEKAHLAESGPLINSGSVHLSGYTGIGATVAVIDTGIDTNHPDLLNDLIWEECFLSGGGCPVTGGTRASGSGSAEDGDGHGTHVSGIITSGHATYTGIAPDTKIVAI